MTDDGGEERQIAQCCELLSDPIRRHVLYYLKEQDAATEDELADVVATWLSSRGSNGAVTATERTAIAIELSHVHLPKLETADVLDSAGERWALASVPDVLCDLLETTVGHEETVPESLTRAIQSAGYHAEE